MYLITNTHWIINLSQPIWINYLLVLWINSVNVVNCYSTSFGRSRLPILNTPPLFDFQRDWIIVENEKLNSRITIVKINDNENDRITFSISSGLYRDGSKYFTINPTTGEVKLTESLVGLAGKEMYLMIIADDGHQKSKIEVRIRIVGTDSWNGKQAKPYQGSQVTIKKQSDDNIQVSPHPLDKLENRTGISSTINSTIESKLLTTPRSSLSSSSSSSSSNGIEDSPENNRINNRNNNNNRYDDDNGESKDNGNSIEMVNNIDQPTVDHSQIHHLLRGSSGYPGLPVNGPSSSNLLRSYQGHDESLFNPKLTNPNLIWPIVGLMSVGLALGLSCVLLYQRYRPSFFDQTQSSNLKSSFPVDNNVNHQSRLYNHPSHPRTGEPKVCVNKSESSGTGISSISFSTRSSAEYEHSAFIGWSEDYEKPLSSSTGQQQQQQDNHIPCNSNNNIDGQLTTREENYQRECMEGGKGRSIDGEINLSNNKIFDEWEYPRSKLRVIDILGEGFFGRVWKCEAFDIKSREGASIVAVKALKEGVSVKERLDLDNELTIMKKLSTHPNVVSLLGCCTEKEPKFLILEYVPFDSLQTYLRNHRAKGMEHIVSQGIIHRDLAARNILIGTNKTCKITDFGFSREISDESIYESKSEGRLPIRWMAPEALKEYIFSVKSDVWSFGVLLWEIVTLGSTPYPGMNTKEVMRKVINGYRLDKPDHCRREMYNIMYYCWETSSTSRPTFTELIDKLDKLIASETDYIQLDRFPDHLYYNIIDTPLSGEKL
ncbi:dual specificity protein kinase shkD-like isoform X2 [Panonychus citri]|uniref:dual specificity protein kinase shkD-like isoform X2 n=1 Tax=Panonychus citri TaxID=50023 RepID=UPI0023081770|nr:dual specificity protein kinase shkD-like isoform X2 [Panonychus citri]